MYIYIPDMDIGDEYVVRTLPTKDYILDIIAARAAMRIYKVNSVKKDAFPQHNISDAEYKEILITIYSYKYTFGLAAVGG